MDIRYRMEQLVKQLYPDAELVGDFYTAFGHELVFFPNKDADDPLTCVYCDGEVTILSDF